MQKIILFAILVMTVAIPVAAAREPRPGLALRKAVWWMLAGMLLYLAAVLFVYPRFVG